MAASNPQLYSVKASTNDTAKRGRGRPRVSTEPTVLMGFHITKPEKHQLRMLAAKLDISMSELLRQMIQEYVSKENIQIP